jgi:hypothetical protein
LIFLARGIEDDNYMVVEDADGALVDAAWRVEREPGGYTLSHADESALTDRVQALGWFTTPEDAVESLRAFLAH